MRVLRILFVLVFIQCSSVALLGQRVTVAVNQNRILYLGFKNKVQIAVDGYTQSQIVDIKVKGGHYLKEENDYYVVPDSGRWIYLSVKIRKKNGKTFWTKPEECRVRKMARPDSYFGGNNGIINKEALKYYRYLYVGEQDGFAPAYIHFSVKSFDIAIIGGANIYFEHVDGNQITYEIKKVFDQLNGGEIIYFYNIFSVLQETKFPIFAEPTLLRVRSSSTSSNYIINGLIKDNGKDSSITLKTQNPIEEDYKRVLKNRDRTWLLHPIGCDSSKVLLEQHYDNNTLKSYRQYDLNSKLVSEEVYGNVITRIDFTNGLKIREYTYVRDWKFNQYQLTRTENDTEYTSAKKGLVGKWSSYYANGQMKQEGNFDTLSKEVSDTFISYDKQGVYGTRDVVSYTLLTSFKTGTWETYSETGTLLKTEIYEMGKLKKD